MMQMGVNPLTKLAIPGVVVLISFLSYSSQYLFPKLDPGPLSKDQYVKFNVLVACIWICYARACLTNPGHVPREWTTGLNGESHDKIDKQSTKGRFCRKCDMPKPARSHHCKICQRCIPKMDHHCPWTYNCVSHLTFPHFIRFLFYAVTSMAYLEYFLYLRTAVIWQNRKLPSYLGPSPSQLIHLFFLILVNSLTLFMVGITFVRSLYALSMNTTTIESWEIDRHEQLLRRARVLGGFLDGPDGVKIKLQKHEFPYDIGIFQNIRDGMGTSNIIAWFWPLAQTPRTAGVQFEINGFEEPGTSWPPPDPDRMPRLARTFESEKAFTYQNQGTTMEEEISAFKQRQQADLAHRKQDKEVVRRRPFHKRFDDDGRSTNETDYLDEDAESLSGEEGWQDYGGNRLADYGVEEDVEFYDEDDIPISELLRRKEERRRNV